MKMMPMLSVIALLMTFELSANGGAKSTDMERGAAAVDEMYTDELKTKKAAPKRTDKTRQKMMENPRNLSFPGSFGEVNSKEDQQERQEESLKRLNEFKNDPYWDNGNGATTNRKINNRDPRD